jgi:hypothetical protein
MRMRTVSDRLRALSLPAAARRVSVIPVVLAAIACAEATEPDAAAGPDRSTDWAAALRHDAFAVADTTHPEIWLAHAARGVPADLAARARAIGGQWKLLAVAQAWCTDAVSAVPFLAALADSVPGMELRVIAAKGNDHLFEGHELNGRRAHPLVLVLDEAARVRGAWIERPADLAAWIDARRGVLPDDDLRLYRQGWYAGNGGRAAVAEVLDLMEAVRDGRAPAPPAPAPTAAEDRPITPCGPDA